MTSAVPGSPRESVPSVAQSALPQQAQADLLFQPRKLGALTLPHRIVMAPADAFACRPTRQCSNPSELLLLRAAGVGGSDHHRGHAGFSARAGLCVDARDS